MFSPDATVRWSLWVTQYGGKWSDWYYAELERYDGTLYQYSGYPHEWAIFLETQGAGPNGAPNYYTIGPENWEVVKEYPVKISMSPKFDTWKFLKDDSALDTYVEVGAASNCDEVQYRTMPWYVKYDWVPEWCGWSDTVYAYHRNSVACVWARVCRNPPDFPVQLTQCWNGESHDYDIFDNEEMFIRAAGQYMYAQLRWKLDE